MNVEHDVVCYMSVWHDVYMCKAWITRKHIFTYYRGMNDWCISDSLITMTTSRRASSGTIDENLTWLIDKLDMNYMYTHIHVLLFTCYRGMNCLDTFIHILQWQRVGEHPVVWYMGVLRDVFTWETWTTHTDVFMR